MKVWIDQDLCTGDGLCTDHAPAVFTLLEDGIAYVKQGDRVLNDPGSAGSLASVPPALEHDVVQAADDCPGECIFIEWIGADPPGGGRQRRRTWKVGSLVLLQVSPSPELVDACGVVAELGLPADLRRHGQQGARRFRRFPRSARRCGSC